jgi:copper chaperone
MTTTQLKISGMSCQHCASAVARALESVSGVSAVEVDLASGSARIVGVAPAPDLIRAVTDAGYAAEPAH